MEHPLRLGIAGAGFGAAVHLPVFRALPGVEIVALAAAHPETARSAAARFGVDACTGIEALLDQPLDAVSLALPPAETERAAAAALARGFAVLAEKPLAATAAAAARLAEQARGQTAAIGFQFADAPAFIALGTALRDGVAGPLRAAEIIWTHESYAHRHGRWGWKLDAERQGGVMAMLGSHILFLIERFLGRVASLQASFDRRATARIAPRGAHPAEDFASLTATLDSGVPVAIVLGNATPGLSRHRWTLACESGALVLENVGYSTASGFALSLHERGGASRLLLREEADGMAGDDRQPTFRRLAERFVAAARRGEACAPDFAAGARVQRLIEASFAAAAGGERVAV
ncbi:MAG TPA: Gfo/Idh/MocA family oxidoreductase [Stellaceae bacterium]|nr:Gfo/Idh/MocA family oxidoreductase [Stellaceae bacterium]